MISGKRFSLKDACGRPGRLKSRAFFQNWSRPLALFFLSALFVSLPAWSQIVTITASNSSPLEGPAAGTDAVLLYVSGLQGTAGTAATVTTDADWITLLSTVAGTNALNVKNGPNRLRFQFAANTGVTRSGYISAQLLDGSAETIVTVTQAGAGFVPAAPITMLLKSI